MSIFDQLKRNKLPVAQTYSAAISGEKLFFLLRHDSKGSYIETVDQAGQETEFDYRRFSGVLRSIAKNIQLARDRSHFTIDWENSENRLYRHEHPFLIPSMLESGHFVNEGMLPIKELKGKAQLNLLLEREREHLFTAKMHCCFREKHSTTLMI